MATKKKARCRFGSKCYRRNPQHLKDFSHPDDSENEDQKSPEKSPENSPEKSPEKSPENSPEKSPEKSPENSPEKSPGKSPEKVRKESPEEGPKKRSRTMEDFFKPGKKAKVEEKEASPKKAADQSAGEPSGAGNASGYRRETTVEEAASDESGEEGPASPTDVKQNITSKFLMEMPEDFYEFWEFASSLNSKNPRGAFKAKLGLQLVGPFDILAGRSCKKNTAGNKPNYLLHWRYFYDPPEFMTVVKGDDESQFHFGYFRDDPKEMPCFVASNSAKENCTITPRGENLFAAVSWYIDTRLKKEKSEGLKSLKTALSDWANKNDITLELKTKAMKSRDKKVVDKTFHGAGLVVPVDPVTEVGYRELPEAPAELKRIFRKITDSKSDEERDRNFDPLMEIITLVQFANDECDYGEGVELGLDLFSYGQPVFHKTVLNLLPLGYEFLGREAFGKIIKAHLKNRKRSANLDQLA